MTSRDAALLSTTAIPASAALLALTAWATAEAWDTIAPHAASLAALALFSALSSILSFSPTGREQVSLHLAYYLAAALVLPFPAPLIVACAGALLGSLFRVVGRLAVPGALATMGASIAIAGAIAGAASGIVAVLGRSTDALTLPLIGAPETLPSRTILGQSLLAGALIYLGMCAVSIPLGAAWSAIRGGSARAYAVEFLGRIFPYETVCVPFGSLIGFALARGPGLPGVLLLGGVGLYMSWLLRSLGESDELLRSANSDLEARAGELAMLNAIGREISTSLDPNAVFEIVRKECRKVLRPDFFWIAHLDTASREVRVDYALAGEGPVRTTSLTLGRGVASRVIESERSLLVSDTTRDPRLKEIDPIVIEPKIRSILAVPLVAEKTIVGVLSVQTFRPDAYTERHLALLRTIGQQAAAAIDASRRHHLATLDRLTGLLLREAFMARIEEEVPRAKRYATPFAVLILDLDSFRHLNERFGRASGDRMLREVGALIRASLREADAACRYGGEEFALLLPETDLAGARTMADRLRGEIGALQVQVGAHLLGTTISVGIAAFPAHFDGSLDGLLARAGDSLVEAKRRGKDRVVAPGV